MEMYKALQTSGSARCEICVAYLATRRPNGGVRERTHHSADTAGQREGGEGAGVHAIGVQVPNVDLHTCVVLGCNQLVGP